ncbi:hypothetical protein LKL35_05050 [Streptomyces sp. ET3-23]|uniref:hypothetical protein n=1 Tax=Streptomyces sp. ET3-23 TaxID=2885643 RepID=UPI001D120E2D|nr:hypothetical protein [Streptomyces sp. ET3-23]MCC2274808.1 hypothetical protein [Streptomyces sp. ET3-23]
MSHVTMRHIAAVAASAALLSGAAAAAGSAAYADAPGHQHHGAGVSAEHKEEAHVTVQGNHHDHGLHLGWDKGVDKKKDHFDAKHKVWQRWDGDSRSYARWDEHTRSWERTYKGHVQHWDNAHKAWK